MKKNQPKPSVAFHTLGCKTNQLESSAIAEDFQREGWDVVAFEDPATLYIINTCTVTERGDSESRRVIRKAKQANPNAKIAVTGCYAQIAPQQVAEVAGVDFVIGNNYKAQFFEHLKPHLMSVLAGEAQAGPIILVDDFDKSRVVEGVASASGLDRTRGSLKIQDGCDYKCTYCIIWKARGPSKSVPVPEVLQLLTRMVEEGFKEIVLTGINIGQYLWEDPETNRVYELADLLEATGDLPGEFRLRLTSLDPLEVTDRLIDVVATSQGRICPHFHLSTQSAEDTVLKLMARRHHVKDLVHVCETIHQKMPQACISGDVIVGFPGETDERFEATYDVLKAIPFHQLHVFRYSPRPGTPAADVRPQVPDRVRKERAQRLIALAEAKSLAFNQQFIGQPLTMLVEQHPDELGASQGMTENYLKVKLPLGMAASPNTLKKVSLSAIGEEGTLYATPLFEEEIPCVLGSSL